MLLTLALPVASAGVARPIPDDPDEDQETSLTAEEDWDSESTAEEDSDEGWVDEDVDEADPWQEEDSEPRRRGGASRHSGRLERRSSVDDTIRGTIRTVPVRIERLSKESLKLATKGATYSANAKLIEILELIADNIDADEGASDHSAALAAGLTALRESEDFVSSSTHPTNRSRIADRAVGHSTPVVRRIPSEGITRLEALEMYHSYASRQLAKAVAGVPAGAETLCQLGRLQPFLRERRDQQSNVVTTRMVTLQEAALLADPQNYRAANELGVILAKSGQLRAAKESLIYSAYIGKRPETLRNLSVVLNKMGDHESAKTMLALAVKQQNEPKTEVASKDSDEHQSLVYWVSHQEFAERAATSEIDGPIDSAAPKSNDAKLVNPPKKPEKGKSSGPKFFQSMKNAFRRQGDKPEQEPAKPKIQPTGETAKTNLHAAPEEEIDHEESNNVELAGYRRRARRDAELQEQSSGEALWWDVFNQGEYVGPARTQHVPDYYLRVDDSLGFVFRLNGRPSTEAYRLNVGDVIQISSLTDTKLSLQTLIQPDGTIALPQVGTVSAVGKTIDGLRQELDVRYQEFIRDPSITVAPVAINKTLEELRAAIINRSGIFNGQLFSGKVTPDGTIQLPAIGSVPAQGLTLAELRSEVENRYAEIAGGIEVTPVLQQRAPRNIYVIGEVSKPGRYELVAPTTAIQAISLAGGWNKGGNLTDVIVFRRDENWRLMATRVNVRPALYNSRELEADDIWLRDSDIVIVPKLAIQVCDDYIEMIFTKGLYGVVPVNFTVGYFKNLTTIGAALQ
ncbi:MAG: polysaccharide biosynthesis/export family protein [Planctomycetaceae bacterium]